MVDWINDDGGRAAAGYKGRTGDCVARAIAIASGRPYSEVYESLALGNHKQRKGKRPSRHDGVKTAAHGINVKRQWFREYMERLGFVWKPCMTIGSGCKVHLLASELPSSGRLVLSLSKHYAAFVDGKLHDTYDSSREGTRCVYGYYQWLDHGPESIFKQFESQAKTALERDALAWAKDPTISMVESEDGVDERQSSGETVRMYMLTDLKYRLGEQLSMMVQDQVGQDSYRKDLAFVRAAERLAERLV